MASISNKYLVQKEENIKGKKQSGSAMFHALMFSTGNSDLTDLMIATETGVERLPVLTLNEAKA